MGTAEVLEYPRECLVPEVSDCVLVIAEIELYSNIKHDDFDETQAYR